jgi:hypothetical protein
MSRQNVFNLRLSDEELARLQAYAEFKQISAAEVLRDYIKRLPRKIDGGFSRLRVPPPV